MRSTSRVRLSLVVLVLCGALACADDALSTAPRAPEASGHLADPAGHGKKTQVATCKPQKEDEHSARVGPKGGSLSVGTNRLVIPAGALATEVEITAHAPPSNAAELEFSPAGLQFAKPAQLTMSYAKCYTPFFGVTVAYLQADMVTEVEPSRVDLLRRTVTAQIRHFSSYAVAY